MIIDIQHFLVHDLISLLKDYLKRVNLDREKRLVEAEYEKMMDAVMEAEAERRMLANDPSENKSQQEVLNELGITREELDSIGVDIEK